MIRVVLDHSMAVTHGADYGVLDDVTDAEYLFANRHTSGRAHSIKWIHAIDSPPSMRIEVVISGGQASPTSELTQLTTVQPHPAPMTYVVPPSYLAPLPHDVVMAKPMAASPANPEGRSRQLGRLSRQFVAKYLYRPHEISDNEGSQPPTYTLLCPTCCGGGQWFFFSAPSNRPPGQLFLC